MQRLHHVYYHRLPLPGRPEQLQGGEEPAVQGGAGATGQLCDDHVGGGPDHHPPHLQPHGLLPPRPGQCHRAASGMGKAWMQCRL